MSMCGTRSVTGAGERRPRTRRSVSTEGCRCGPGDPHLHVQGMRRSGVLQEAPLAGPAVGRPAELGQRLVGAAVVLAELVDVAGFLAGGDLAAQFAGDAHELADGVGGLALLAQAAPE